MHQLFKDQQALLAKIYDDGMAKYASQIPNPGKAFEDIESHLHCIDERTPNGIQAAGSTILMPWDEAVRFIKDSKAIKITSHAECGAAGLAYAALSESEQKKYKNSDEYGKAYAIKLADSLGLPHEHIEISKMHGPSGHHVARVAYYDGTGRFDWRKNAAALPQGFIISRKFHKMQEAQHEIDIAISIATGGHGFGELITPENPFLIVVIGDPKDKNFSEEKLKSEVEKLESTHKKRVKIDSFTAPL